MVGMEFSVPQAKDMFKKCPLDLAFKFLGNTGRTIATVTNLSELISILPEIPATIAQFHIYRETTQDIFESRQLDGPVVRSDLALWISYILGDHELARRVYEIGKSEKDAEKLKYSIITLLKERERELIDFIKSS